MLNTLLAVAQKEKMNNIGTHPTFFLKIWDVSLCFPMFHIAIIMALDIYHRNQIFLHAKKHLGE